MKDTRKLMFVFRLYIVEGTPCSTLAVTNLKVLCEKYFGGLYRLQILDVMDCPCRLLTDRVLATPTLIKVAPGPQTRIVGDLSAEDKVLAVLRGALEAD